MGDMRRINPDEQTGGALKRAMQAADEAEPFRPRMKRPTMGADPAELEPSRSVAVMVVDHIDALITARAKTHGDFTDTARVAQQFKNVAKDAPQWRNLTDVQREALEMSLHKMARILTGDPNSPEHWEDLQGYPRLVQTRLSHASASS